MRSRVPAKRREPGALPRRPREHRGRPPRPHRATRRWRGQCAAASEMVADVWATQARSQARAIVERMFSVMLLRDDVLAALRARPNADPALQAACLDLAATWAEPALECNNAGFALVRDRGRPGGLPARPALGPGRLPPRARERRLPQHVRRGPVSLRADRSGARDADAIRRLKRRQGTRRPGLPCHGPSEPGPARRGPHLLARLRDVLSRRIGLPPAQAAEDRAFLSEAEVVVLYDPVFPANPFE